MAHETHPLAGCGVVEGGLGVEELPVGPEAHLREGAARGLQPLQVVAGREAVAVAPAGQPLAEVQSPDVAVTTHLHTHALRQGVDHRGSHPVQPAAGAVGGPVGAAAELAPRVQFREHHLHRRDVPPGRLAHGDAAAVVTHGDRAVPAEGHVDPPGMPGGRLVDAVVDQFPHQVHEPVAAGAPDVHARPLADRLQALQGLDGVGLVVPGARRVLCGLVEEPQRRLLRHPHHRLWPAARIGLGPERATSPRRVGGSGNGTGSPSGALGRSPVSTNTSTSGPT